MRSSIELDRAEVVEICSQAAERPGAGTRGQFENTADDTAVDFAIEHRARRVDDAIAGIGTEGNREPAASTADRARVDDGAGGEIDPDPIVVAGARIACRDDPARQVDDGPPFVQVSPTSIADINIAAAGQATGIDQR